MPTSQSQPGQTPATSSDEQLSRGTSSTSTRTRRGTAGWTAPGCPGCASRTSSHTPRQPLLATDHLIGQSLEFRSTEDCRLHTLRAIRRSVTGVRMWFARGRCFLAVAAVGAVLVLAGGCSSAVSDVGGESRPSVPSRTPSASGRPLSAAELVAALPTEGALPGYRVLDAPKSTDDDGASSSDVRPKACRPLWDARVRAATSVADARIPISRSEFAPPTEFLSFAGYESGDAKAHLASLDKALSWETLP